MARVTIIGNLATAPEVTVTSGGAAFVRFMVAENSGHRDRQTGEWVEDDATFWPVTLWGDDAARNVVASLNKGDRVQVSGRTRTNSWTVDGESQPRSRVELTADDVAVSLRFARASVVKVRREGEPVGAHSASAASAPF